MFALTAHLARMSHHVPLQDSLACSSTEGAIGMLISTKCYTHSGLHMRQPGLPFMAKCCTYLCPSVHM